MALKTHPWGCPRRKKRVVLTGGLGRRKREGRAPEPEQSNNYAQLAQTRMAVPEPVSLCFHVTYAETQTNNLGVSLDAVS